jgi:hypothetical protein
VATIQAQLLVAGVLFVAGFGSGFYLESDLAEGKAAKLAADSQDQYINDLAAAEAIYRQKSDATARAVAAADQQTQQQLKESQNALADARARVRSNGMFLDAYCPQVSLGGLPTATSAPSFGDGASKVRLSDADAQFLLDFAGRCDAVADQLRGAQAVIKADRQ